MEPASANEPPCPPLFLRQAKELPQGPPLIPVERPSRRLALDQDLVSAARGASPKTTRRAVKSIRSECEKELLAVCMDQVLLVHEVSRVVNDNAHSPLMVEALRNVHGCLAANSDALRPTCLATLVREFLKNTPPLDSAPSDPSSVWSPSDPPSAIHGKHRKSMRHHKTDHDENDSSDVATEGLLYGISNMNGEDTPTMPQEEGARIDQWDHGTPRRHHRSHPDSDDLHPLVWLVVLPFFCVGVFVTVKRAVKLYRQRRGYDGATCEYVPLNAHDGPSQHRDA